MKPKAAAHSYSFPRPIAITWSALLKSSVNINAPNTTEKIEINNARPKLFASSTKNTGLVNDIIDTTNVPTNIEISDPITIFLNNAEPLNNPVLYKTNITTNTTAV